MWKTSNISSSLNDLSQNQNKVPNGNSTTSPPFKKISQKERKRQISINQTPTKPKESERKMASISKAKPATVAWLEDHFRFFFLSVHVAVYCCSTFSSQTENFR